MVSAELAGRWLEARDVNERTSALCQAGVATLVGLAVAKSGTAKAAALVTGFHYLAQAMGAPDYIENSIDALPLRTVKMLLQL